MPSDSAEVIAIESGSSTSGWKPVIQMSVRVTYTAKVITSPWAKLAKRRMPKVSVMPIAPSA